MDNTSYEEYGSLDDGTDFPFASCPRCNEVQTIRILDKRLHTANIVCSNCKIKFCSYCGGDRHILVSCRKELPRKKKSDIDRV